MRKKYVLSTSIMLIFLSLSGIAYAASYTGPWGNWSGTWSDRPKKGQHEWYDYTSTISWWNHYQWTGSGPNSGRRIELEFYDPANSNHCNRLEPFVFYSYGGGGNWVGSWWTDNQCGGAFTAHERLTFTVNSSNVTVGHTYMINAKANILYSASYGGEANVSYTCFACSDDWLGKLIYNSNYAGTSSTP